MKKLKTFISGSTQEYKLHELEGTPINDFAGEEMCLVNVHSDVKYKKLLGFGGAFTEASAVNYAKMNDENKKRVISAYFDEKDGIGYKFCRMHLGSCDFGIEEYENIPDGETNIDGFNIEREKTAIIPMIKDALKHSSDLNIFASPWSPLKYMKTNGSRVGGKLKKEFYDQWAQCYAKFYDLLKNEGITLWGITVQNEAKALQTWESCVYTAEEERDMVVNHLGKLMKERNVNVMFWDHNKELLYDRAKVMYSDKKAYDNVYGIACHWYSGDHFDEVRLLSELYPEKEIIFTEGCCAGLENTTDSAWSFAQKYAHDIIGNLNSGITAFCDWNMILDTNNGPFHSRFSDAYCEAPVIFDEKNNTVVFRPVFYYIAHFSKFIKKDAVRLATSTFSENIEVTAYENPDKSIVVVLLNKSEKDVNVNLKIDNKVAKFKMLGKSIMTQIMMSE